MLDQTVVLGIDIGGSGIKGAPVDIVKGELLAERLRFPTPQPSRPDAIAERVAEIVRQFAWHGPIGCTFPAVIKQGVAYSAANVDRSWIGTDGDALFEQATGCPVHLINDADAAGIAEMRFGAGRGQRGVVMLLTLGTGIGSAIFIDGILLPNTELGHMELNGKEAEHRASGRAREERKMSWKTWSKHLSRYLQYLEALFSPDLFIIGGGVSRQGEKFLPLLKAQTPIVPAQLRNEAGIVGAALAAAGHLAAS
jgi:polyphosphate glucokinase